MVYRLAGAASCNCSRGERRTEAIGFEFCAYRANLGTSDMRQSRQKQLCVALVFIPSTCVDLEPSRFHPASLSACLSVSIYLSLFLSLSLSLSFPLSFFPSLFLSLSLSLSPSLPLSPSLCPLLSLSLSLAFTRFCVRVFPFLSLSLSLPLSLSLSLSLSSLLCSSSLSDVALSLAGLDPCFRVAEHEGALEAQSSGFVVSFRAICSRGSLLA